MLLTPMLQPQLCQAQRFTHNKFDRMKVSGLRRGRTKAVPESDGWIPSPEM